MGLPRPPGSPITLPATNCGHTLPVVIAPRPCAGLGGDVTAHYFAPDGRQRPGNTQGCIAVSPQLLIRMRSQVQVLAGPPPILAGHSAAGSKPGTLAGGWGRAGAARPIPAGPSSGPSGSAHPGVRLGDDHPPWSRTQPRTAATRQVPPPRAAACTRTHRAAARDGRSPGLACLAAQRASAAAAARTQPGGPGPPLTSH
jgi:hypothetical protein